MEEFRKFSAQDLTILTISDRATFERLLDEIIAFGHEKIAESINKVANAASDAQKSLEKFEIAVRKAKRTEMYKRHFNKKRA